ncbi:hypothetical protein CBR_g9125 [Chara braunii]|uniref:Uncharacterized protein n=1 Tax=Chara braunii TaxID=69332 RepID=A0A388KNU1_CHABU|nr:hypothetical protein CBR_g9125 [Chara braunii]|eukprot:GBG71714.1 hypothetical protein CBR_g9125 [Chara braunii]
MWNALFGRRERFSLEEFRYLYDLLQKYPIITDSNKDIVVETLRSIAELMIWGDQHEPAFLDFFIEKELLAHFLRILRNSKRRGGVAVQLLQTLSIMIQNIRSDRAVDYMFREGYINKLIQFPFDFTDEELLAYYISFLRTISMRLNSTRVKFFIFQKDDGTLAFPLYTEAIRFFHHEESMVRIAVRTLTLNIYNVNEESVREFILSENAVEYFSDLVSFVRQRSFTLDSLIGDAERQGGTKTAIGRLEGEIAETGDLLFYCNDIACAGIPGLSSIMTEHLMNALVLPVLLASLWMSSGEEESSDHQLATDKIYLTPLCAMYLLSRLLHVVAHKPLLEAIVSSMCNSLPVPHALPENGRPPSKGGGGGNGTPLENGMIVNASVEKAFSHRSLSPTETGMAAIATATQLALDDNGKLYEFVSGSLKDTAQKAEGRQNGKNNVDRARDRREQRDRSGSVRQPRNAREVVMAHLRGDDDRLVLAALCVLVSLLRNKDADEVMLDMFGVLPYQKLQKKLLLQALVSSSSEAELQKIFPSPAEPQAGLNSRRMANHDVVPTAEDICVHPPESNKSDEQDVFPVELRTRRFQVLDALTALLSRRPPPCAEAIWHAGWLLRQLLPNAESKLNESRWQSMDIAYKASLDDILREMDDCWCDVLPAVLQDEWAVCRRELETPMMQRDSAAVLMPKFKAPDWREGDQSSFVIGERMRFAAKVFVALHQLRLMLTEGSVPRTLSLQEGHPVPPGARVGRKGVPASVCVEGEEVELTAGDSMVCRVAFEKGKERAVHLLVAASGHSGSLILADGSQNRLGWGVVRVIAPLAGCRPRIDEKHPRWLHLRIRSPVHPPAEAGMLAWNRTRMRRPGDGRWTLAFNDEQRCQTAQRVVAEEIAFQSNAVRQVLQPLIGSVPSAEVSKEITMQLV